MYLYYSMYIEWRCVLCFFILLFHFYDYVAIMYISIHTHWWFVIYAAICNTSQSIGITLWHLILLAIWKIGSLFSFIYCSTDIYYYSYNIYIVDQWGWGQSCMQCVWTSGSGIFMHFWSFVLFLLNSLEKCNKKKKKKIGKNKFDNWFKICISLFSLRTNLSQTFTKSHWSINHHHTAAAFKLLLL